jgi:LysR family nitrogen assimilation transcriptional regulator
MQIRQLEEELKVQLLLRHSRGITPTAAGKLFYRHARQILVAIEQARHEVSSLQDSGPLRLRLGVNPSLVEILGSSLLTEAKTSLPDIKISLAEERTKVLLNAIDQRQLDVALVYDVADRADLSRRALIEEDLLFLTCGNTKRAPDTISFSDVVDSDLAVGGERSVVRSAIETEAARLSLRVKVAYEVHSFSSMMNLVRRGVASTVIPYCLAIRELKKGKLVAQRIVSPQLVRTLYAVSHHVHLPVLEDDRVMPYIDGLVTKYFSAIVPFARPISVIPESKKPPKLRRRRKDAIE